MFIVKEYGWRISFKRVPHTSNPSRFNTLCRIQDSADKNAPLIGLAFLHPKDKPDKLTGKKIALKNALFMGQKDKPIRAVVWKAFWQWVEAWPQSG